MPAATGRTCRLGRRRQRGCIRFGLSVEDADGGEGGEAEVEAFRRRPAAQGTEGVRIVKAVICFLSLL